ncbi:MAG TPA: ABC transporter permease [Gemmatimonadaceae bacterium]|nr:ABC transporter permease [Gemmatimonadaceae bacterium]
MNRGRLWQLIRKEFRQTLRDPRAARMMFISPVLQVLIFGFVVNTDVRHVRTIVFDRDATTESRALVAALTAADYFRVEANANTPADVVRALDHGDAVLGVEIPRGFSADLASGREASVQLLVDGSSANTANVALGYATQIISRFGLREGARVAARASTTPLPAGVDFRSRAWYNPNLKSQVYNVPGVIATVMFMMCLLLTSLAVVREREIGTLEQLMVSPLKPTELILGKTLPVVFIALVDLFLVTATALLLFDIPLRGNFALLLVAAIGYILAGLGIGLWISTVSKTQQEAFMSMFLFFLPAMFLSGFMFPIDAMPPAFQTLTLFNPMRHFLIVVRSIFLRGGGWDVLQGEIVTLYVMGAVVLLFAASRFRKTTA